MTLTRGIPAPGVTSPGITEVAHEDLDTLVHKLAESSFTELLYTGKDLTSAIVWETVAKLLKIRESAFTYTDKDLTGVVVKQYDGLGILVATLTKTLAYTDKDLTSVTTVRT